VSERKHKKEWEVIRLRHRGEYLSVVSAVDERTALKAAIKAFEIADADQQKRLLVRRV
jgi:hypothetical protein